MRMSHVTPHKQEHDRLAAEGKAANQAGECARALELYEAACRAVPKLQTLVSAVNMRRKMGPAQHEACALAYLSILRMEAVGAELRALVEKNLAECLGTLPEGARARLEDEVDELACQRFEVLAAEAADEGQEEGMLFNTARNGMPGGNLGAIRMRGFVDGGGQDGMCFGA